MATEERPVADGDQNVCGILANFKRAKEPIAPAP